MTKKEIAAASAVEEEKKNAIATTGEAGALMEFLDQDDFGAGFEGIDKDSFAIPFIQVLQKMSPRVDEDDPSYIPGAKAGMLYNTVTGELYDGKAGILVIPCAYKRSFILWGGREGDGGFKGEFTPEQFQEFVDNKEVSMLNGKAYVPDEKGVVNEKKSDYYADTRSHYVLVYNPETGETGIAVIALSSSLTKASKTLMTLLQQKKIETAKGKMTPPTFANLARMTTVSMRNDKGSWSGVKFDLEGMVPTQAILADAREFYKQIIGGKVKADHSKADREASEGEVGGTSEAESF